MPADPRLLFLSPLRKHAEELAQERCAYRVVALGGHPWADLPEWLRAQDIETEAHLLADLSRPASRDAVARLVAEALGLECGATAPDFELRDAEEPARWSLDGLYDEREFCAERPRGYIPPSPNCWLLVPALVGVTDPAEALTVVAIATLGASDAR